MILISPQPFCQAVKRQLVTLGRNCLLKSSVQRRCPPINSCLLDDPWKVTDHPEESITIFKFERDWVLMLSEPMLKVNKSTVITMSFAEKGWKCNCCSYTVHERCVFEFKSPCTANRRACECFSRIIPVNHLFHFELGTQFFTPIFSSTLITIFVCLSVKSLSRRYLGWPGAR